MLRFRVRLCDKLRHFDLRGLCLAFLDYRRRKRRLAALAGERQQLARGRKDSLRQNFAQGDVVTAAKVTVEGIQPEDEIAQDDGRNQQIGGA